MTGERSSQAGWLGPSKFTSRDVETGGRIHQFLWQRSRAVSQREKGTERQEAMRNRFESSQVTQAGFGLE